MPQNVAIFISRNASKKSKIKSIII